MAGSMLLASCGSKPSAKTVADKICGMGEKMLKAESEGKDDEAKKIEEEMDVYGKEMREKYKDNEKFLDEVKVLVKVCREELEAKYKKEEE